MVHSRADEDRSGRRRFGTKPLPFFGERLVLGLIDFFRLFFDVGLRYFDAAGASPAFDGVACRVIVGEDIPDFRTISDFRKIQRL